MKSLRIVSVAILAVCIGATFAAIPSPSMSMDMHMDMDMGAAMSRSEMVNKMMQGKFLLVKSDMFEEYLYELGVGYVWRKLGASATPLTEFTKNGDQWTIKTTTTFKTTEINFKLGETFEEYTADGRYCTSKITLEEEKMTMIHKQQCGPSYVPENVIIREFTDKKMIMHLKAGNVKSIRVYDRVL